MPVIGRYAVSASNNWLSQYARNVVSQTGEDGVIEKIFELVPATGERWCVEFGAWDGKHFSNTWNLIANRGWNGVLIEASEQRFTELVNTYRDNPRAICVNKLIRFEGEDSLDDALAATPIPKNFDLLSIDVDGNDYHIWESVVKFEPKAVVIEINPTIPNDVAFVQEKNMTVNQGNSLLAMVLLGRKKGYELVGTTTFNAFFVKKEFYPAFRIANNDIFLMYNPGPFETKFFQLYDGTLVLNGCQSLVWHGIAIREEAIQVLPPELRRFPDSRT